MKLRIALDVDEVLAQFYPAICKKAGIPPRQINIWDGKIEANFIPKALERVAGNSRFWMGLEKLSNPEDIEFEVAAYITSSPATMRSYREQWLMFHGFPKAPVVQTRDKVGEMRKRNIQVLVDDNPVTLAKVKANGLIAIQFVPPYMREIYTEFTPIRHLSEVPEKVAQIERAWQEQYKNFKYKKD